MVYEYLREHQNASEGLLDIDIPKLGVARKGKVRNLWVVRRLYTHKG